MNGVVTCSAILLHTANTGIVIGGANFHAVMLHLSYSEAVKATEHWGSNTHQMSRSLLFPTFRLVYGSHKATSLFKCKFYSNWFHLITLPAERCWHLLTTLALKLIYSLVLFISVHSCRGPDYSQVSFFLICWQSYFRHTHTHWRVFQWALGFLNEEPRPAENQQVCLNSFNDLFVLGPGAGAHTYL